jgi:hypothetical protein
MKFDILNRFTDAVQFTAEIDCNKDESILIKIGLAVKWAVKNKANLRSADLRSANLSSADLSSANLLFANLSSADLSSADLSFADLRSANLRSADLSFADLRFADLRSADLRSANLSSANLSSANLSNTKNMVKIMGVEPGNTYWKRFEDGLCNNGYQFQVGINKLNKGEVFADDERVTCSSPGFHFASRSWCAVNYPERHLEAKIKIPLKAKINEPWATDGKASADMIEILQVFDTETGKDVTKLFKKK